MTRNFLFCVDQVAGGEYILPLLQRWQGVGATLYASEVSSRLLNAHGFATSSLADASPGAATLVLEGASYDGIVLSASAKSDLERSFLEAASRMGLPSVQFVDTWVNVAERFSLERLPNRIAVADESMATILRAAGVDGERVSIVGQPFLESKLLRAPPPEHRGPPKALVVTQPISRHYGASLGYDERSFVQTCLAAWRSLGRPDEDLTLLVHPSEDEATYRSLLPPSVAVVKGAALADLPHSVVLGMFSSLLVESVLLGSPTISVQPTRAGRNLCSLVDARFVPLARDERELSGLLEASVAEPRRAAAGLEAFRDAMMGSLDRFEQLLGELAAMKEPTT